MFVFPAIKLNRFGFVFFAAANAAAMLVLVRLSHIKDLLGDIFAFGCLVGDIFSSQRILEKQLN